MAIAFYISLFFNIALLITLMIAWAKAADCGCETWKIIIRSYRGQKEVLEDKVRALKRTIVWMQEQRDKADSLKRTITALEAERDSLQRVNSILEQYKQPKSAVGQFLKAQDPDRYYNLNP